MTHIRSYESWRQGSGGGIGLNFFFARFFGSGWEGSVYDNAGTASWLPRNGNFFLRYPICPWRLAPCVMVGSDAEFSEADREPNPMREKIRVQIVAGCTLLQPENGDSCRGILKEFLNRRFRVYITASPTAKKYGGSQTGNLTVAL